MKAVSRRRKDGRCALKGCTKKLQTAGKGQDALAKLLAVEPFCSARCCRTFHGVVLSQPEQDEKARAANGEKRREREAA